MPGIPTEQGSCYLIAGIRSAQNDPRFLACVRAGVPVPEPPPIPPPPSPPPPPPGPPPGPSPGKCSYVPARTYVAHQTLQTVYVGSVNGSAAQKIAATACCAACKTHSGCEAGVLGVGSLEPGNCYLLAGIHSFQVDKRFTACVPARNASGGGGEINVEAGGVRLQIGAATLGLRDVIVTAGHVSV